MMSFEAPAKTIKVMIPAAGDTVPGMLILVAEEMQIFVM